MSTSIPQVPQAIAVILKINSGSFSQGFPVSLRILENGRLVYEEDNCGQLPPLPELPQTYSTWQGIYQALGDTRVIQPISQQVTNHSSIRTCKDALTTLADCLRSWFALLPFRALRDQIIAESRLERRDLPVPIIIDIDTSRTLDPTDLLLLRKLPWHLWDLFSTRYLPNAEVVLGMKTSRPSTTLTQPVKILAVFGSDAGGLDLDPDRQALRQLEAQHGAQIMMLEQPNRQHLHEQLWNHPWDILFFGGHSASEVDCQEGYLQINHHQKVALTELREDLNQAIAKGLKLAIFNSCDGLGIANYLVNLQVPYVVAMREPVPDRVAREFLKEFLQVFCNGIPLSLAVRKARMRLHWMESDDQWPCPAASWLPVVCQNSVQPELVWLPSKPSRFAALTFSDRQKQRFAAALLMTGIGAIALGAGWLAWPSIQAMRNTLLGEKSALAEVGDRTSAGERLLVNAVETPAKQEGVNAFRAEEYAEAVEWFELSLQIQPNDPETRIYLNNARLRAENQDFYTIATSVPIGNNPGVAQEILRGVAQAQDEINQAGGVNGAGVEVRIFNDNNDPAIAKEIAEYIIQPENANILAFVGHNTGDASMAAAPIYQQNGIVMISPTTFNAEVSRVGDYIFRAVPTPQAMSDPLVKYILAQSSQAPKLLICYDSSAPDQVGFRNAFVDILTSEGGDFMRLVDDQERDMCDYALDSFDPTRVIDEAIAQGINGIFVGTNINNFEPTLALIRANRRRLPLFSSPTVYTQKVIQDGQQDVEGMVLVAPWTPEAHPDFAGRSRDLWGATVNWRTATAYDATRAVIAGLQQNPTRAGLQQALQRPDFSTDGSGDLVRFLDSRDRRMNPVLIQVQPDSSGRYRFVYLPATAP